MTQVLCHLDKLYLGSGAMLLFKYPLLSKKMEEVKTAIMEEIEAGEGEAEVTEEEINERVILKAFETPLAEDLE